MSHADSNTSAQPFLHGTKADLEPGDLIKVGYKPNFATTVLGLLHARWMRRPGVQNWPLVRGAGGSTSSSRPALSKTIPTSLARSSPAIPRSHIAPANRFGSLVKSRTGSPIWSNSCSR